MCCKLNSQDVAGGLEWGQRGEDGRREGWDTWEARSGKDVGAYVRLEAFILSEQKPLWREGGQGLTASVSLKLGPRER